jgi:diguanylate cyclase (GGDEF)-like protein
MTADLQLRNETPRVLIVDDDATSRAVLARRLARIGIDVSEAQNGTAAVPLLMGEDFDLVVLDLEMPELDGFGLLEIVRGHPRLRHLPVVVLTGDETRETAEAAMRAGATSYLVKPLNWTAFGPHIKHLSTLVRSSRVALENMAQGLAMFEPGGDIALCNSQFRSLLQAPSFAAAAGVPVTPGWLAECRSVVRSGQPVERSAELPDGRYLASTFRPLAEGGWVEVHRDITEQRRMDARINYLARHDCLTGLVNRTEFNERLASELARARRGSHTAVLCVDLDDFKSVNDTHGHPAGDRVLRAVSDRLRAVVRETDTVGRLGGDEFAIIQVAATQPEGAGSLAARLVDAMAQPFDVDGHRAIVGASIGIALAPMDGLDPETLLRKADLALYRAKSNGGGNFCYFEPEMDVALKARRQMERDLAAALPRGELELHYQPLVSLAENRITGFEALIRWNHPVRGRVSPGEFIPLAEEIGLISAMGAWAIDRACEEALHWPEDVTVAVNVSPCQFRSRDLVAVVDDALRRSGLAPHRLQLEITETVLLSNTELTLEMLHDLHMLGVTIAMDDFGTGYSSLSYLRKFPFDKLKIDKAFIDNITVDRDSASIVRAVSELARSLGIRTTAEGVETSELLTTLRALGCDEIQGYLFGRPSPASSVAGVLAADKGRAKAA